MKYLLNTTKCCNADYVLSIDNENNIKTNDKFVCNECQGFCEIYE